MGDRHARQFAAAIATTKKRFRVARPALEVSGFGRAETAAPEEVRAARPSFARPPAPRPAERSGHEDQNGEHRQEASNNGHGRLIIRFATLPTPDACRVGVTTTAGRL